MCGIPSIFVTLNISTFCRLALVVTFPTQLDSPDLEFGRESYCISGFAALLVFLSGVSVVLGPESPAPGFEANCLAHGACGIEAGVGPEFPRSFRQGRSFRPQGPEFPAHLVFLR